MAAPSAPFRRARQPEQVAARRAAILAAARELLATQPLAEISLRDLSDRVGLAKSNVVRYFDSREAVFLALLAEEWRAWLADVEARLTEAASVEAALAEAPMPAPFAAEARVAAAVTAAIRHRPLYCELISAMAGVLERNIALGTARAFKQETAVFTMRLAALVRQHLPVLDEAAGEHFAGAVLVLLAGIWPLTHPTPAVRTAQAELHLPDPVEMLAVHFQEGLTNLLVGMTTRARAGVRPATAGMSPALNCA